MPSGQVSVWVQEALATQTIFGPTQLANAADDVYSSSTTTRSATVS
jgi:hypothetical protein